MTKEKLCHVVRRSMGRMTFSAGYTTPSLRTTRGSLRPCHAVRLLWIIMTVTCAPRRAARLLSALVVMTSSSRDFSGLRRYKL